MKQITVLIADPDKDIRKSTVDNSLEAMQKLVGGYIETITLQTGQVLIVNEEGAIKAMKLNRLIKTSDLIMAFHGPIVMARVSGDEFTSVLGHDSAWLQYHSQAF